MSASAPPKQQPPRIQIQEVWPSLDGGRWPAKRTLGETLEVTATIFADGHDVLRAAVRHRAPGKRKWGETPMDDLGNDRCGVGQPGVVVAPHLCLDP